MHFVLILSHFLAATPTAFAKLPYGQAATIHSAEEFREHSTVILDKLIQYGQRQIDGLNLVALRDANVQWQPKATNEPLPKEAGTRLSAFYNHNGVKIVTDPNVVTDDLLNVTALHERIGGSHLYNDGNYQLSIGMFFMMRALELHIPLMADLARHHMIQVAEGGTSMGGGGDFIGILMKAKATAYLMKQAPMGVFKRDFDQIANVDVEPDWDPHAIYTRMHFTRNGQMYLSFPAAGYVSMNANQRPVMEELVGLILETFFVRDDAWLKPWIEIRCRDFPRPIYMRQQEGAMVNEETKQFVHRLFGQHSCQFDFNLRDHQ